MMRSHRRPQRRRSFTLAEMLIVIAIIGLVSSSVLMAMWGAMEEAKEVRTRAQIQKLHELLLMRWDGYRTRSMPIAIPPGTDPRAAAQFRLLAIRDLMRMELPDRMTDVLVDRAKIGSTPIMNSNPSLWLSYRRRVDAVWSPNLPWRLQVPLDPQQVPNVDYEGAECLYMIISSIRESNSTGLDFFQDKEIGDVDDDGFPEILDAWGNPIEFIRWAPGYSERSLIQVSDHQQHPWGNKDGDAGHSPDPFDPLRIDYRWRDGVTDNDPYALYPLILSRGRDGESDLSRLSRDFIYPYTTRPNPNGGGTLPWPNDPYYMNTSGNQVGTPQTNLGGGEDDITNHLLLVE